MTDLVRHRGPDDEGYVFFGPGNAPPVACGGPDTPDEAYSTPVDHAPSRPVDAIVHAAFPVAMGHRRLSILDLSTMGHQPMCTHDRRYWIVHNGEIYNHCELRAELSGLGHRFRSHCDTEVILNAYAEWGPGCLDRFHGMWAFAIYDTQRRQFFLARDRFGIKPLYYWMAPSGAFCFASEIKSFTAVPGWHATLNAQAAYDFLAWGAADLGDETMFSRVYQLLPGHCMEVPAQDLVPGHDGRLPVRQWYTLRGRPYAGSFRDASQEFAERFEASMRLHLRADVPVGSCLSGGLDSSSIVCVANRLLREHGATTLQHSFSVCSHEERFDERRWIAEVVDATGVDAHYVYPSFDALFADSPAITWHQDEPFGSSSIYAQWNVFRLAAGNKVKVMLDGQGADELLAGYHAFFGTRFASLVRTGRLIRLFQEVRKTKRIHGYSELKAVMLIANVLLPSLLREPLRAWTGRDSVSPAWLNLHALGIRPRDPVHADKISTENVSGMSKAQLTRTNLQRLLHWEDRNSMAHSVESRVPFLDHSLVEFVLGLPDEYKLSDGMTKQVLREGMRGVLPEKIRTRTDKMGFETPEEVWMRKTAPDVFRGKIRHAIEVGDGLFSPAATNLLEDIIAGRKPFSFTPWRLVNFAEWMEIFAVRTGFSAPAFLPRPGAAARSGASC
ncbi:asparagine synthase (glutamine-hydrolyzing) [Noviherbaspirillum sp.]|jgi:asparagine synthase (glutamine-hydrolysing)|uniref:asparagine synthase (glutamine-hydrolyzing) n=1 Tax=Noviherbaspirillum sp. TaxID=1926288 RepID=UPI0039C92E4C